jgi:site-specific DNA recombinase
VFEVATYRRVSGDEQAKKGISLEHQMQKLSLYCDLKDLRAAVEIEDDGYSAKDEKRPGMIRLLEMMRARAIQGLVIYKLDRLTRSLRDWSNWIHEFFGEKGPIQLFSVCDEINTTTANGRLGLNIIMSVAQWEREVNSERTATNLATHMAAGKRAGKVRFGHGLDPDGPLSRRGNPVMLVEDPRQQAALRAMREMAERGETLRSMCRVLEEMGLETPEGKRMIWYPTTVKRLLERTG